MPGARPNVRWPCSWPDPISSTSGSWPTREVFTRPPEPAVVNLSNPFVLLPHLACAAYERRSRSTTSGGGATTSAKACAQLVLGDRLVLRNRRGRLERAGRARARHRPAHRARPTSTASPRTTVGSSAPSTGPRAFELVHPGAIYLHQGQPFRVVTLDLDDRAAIVEPVDGDEYTQVASETNVPILATEATRRDRPRASCTSARCR